MLKLLFMTSLKKEYRVIITGNEWVNRNEWVNGNEWVNIID